MKDGLDTINLTQNLDGKQNSTRHLPAGTILVNRYMIQEVIGIGGMGAVYRARDMHFPNVNKLVAVKEMYNQARDALVRQTIVQNFEREAHLLASLSHPAIPEIYDFFTFDERSYLVLEYISGQDLEAVTLNSTGFVTESALIPWIVEICDVLTYLHGHQPEPIIFRDIKPSNIMIDQEQHVVLIDFGIAKVFQVGQKGTMIGTEGYAPPEQYRGEATPEADIYALGATMHHVLTGRDPRLEAPFTFGDRDIQQINPAISQALVKVVMKALSYEAEQRYHSAAEMKVGLLEVLAGQPALKPQPATVSMNLPGQNIKPLWSFRCEDEIRGSVAVADELVFVGALDNNLYALGAKDGAFYWKYPSEGGVVSKPLVVGDAVFFGSADGKLYSLSRISGKLNWTYQTGGAIRSSARNIESQIIVGSDDGFLYAIHLLMGTTTWKFEATGAVRSSPFVSNDHIIFGDDSGDVCCLDFHGQLHWRFKAKRGILTSPLVAQDMAFVGALDSNFYALDAKSGWVIWRFRMGKGSSSSPCLVDNLIVFGSADEHIYCLEISHGKEIWRYKTGHQVSGSPLLDKDSIYCGSADGNIYCLEYRTGRLRWKFATGGPITGTPVVHEGILYIGSHDHQVYALNIG